MSKRLSKKQLKQRIAEVFTDVNITNKSHYIRELVEENVSEDLIIKKSKDLQYIKDKIFHINGRQETGYQTFRNSVRNQDIMIKELNHIKTIVLIISTVTLFSFVAICLISK